MTRAHKILLLPGDGIGIEVTACARRVLEAVSEGDPFELHFEEGEIGLGAYQKYSNALPPETLKKMEEAQGVIMGAISAAELPPGVPNPITGLRRLLDLYANVRPIKHYPGLPHGCREADLVVVRENTEGMYSGIEFRLKENAAFALRVITRAGSERIAHHAFKLAGRRRRKVTLIHKASVFRESCRLFLDTCQEVARGYPEVELNEMLVDLAAMQLIKDPLQFDVLLATNLFGDILADEASQLVGGLGMVPGANLGDRGAIFEPCHGSAPKYAGKDVANPAAAILSAKLMLDYLGEEEAGARVERAVAEVIEEGREVTFDLGGSATTTEMTEAILRKLTES